MSGNIEIDSELKQLIDVFFKKNETAEDENKIIYQYTTWNGLKGIIESECLWLTDYQFLNDISEVNYAVGDSANN